MSFLVTYGRSKSKGDALSSGYELSIANTEASTPILKANAVLRLLPFRPFTYNDNDEPRGGMKLNKGTRVSPRRLTACHQARAAFGSCSYVAKNSARVDATGSGGCPSK